MDAILQKPMLTRSQEKKVEILLLLIKSKDKELDEQPDTTAMPEIESEKSTEQGKKQAGQRLKILTPSQMLSRLPITLAQLKAGKNSEQRKK